MILPYTFESQDLSLKHICAVYVAHQLLDASGKLWDYSKDGKKRTTVARSRVEKLKLPAVLQELVERLIEPVNREIILLKRMTKNDINLFVNPQGSFALFQSMEEVVMDEHVPVLERFAIASAYCHEQYVFKLAGQLSEKESYWLKNGYYQRLEAPDIYEALSWLWVEAYETYVEKKQDGDQSDEVFLGYTACMEGFNLSCKFSCDLAMAYFIQKAHSEMRLKDPEAFANFFKYHSNFAVNRPPGLDRSRFAYDELASDVFCAEFKSGNNYDDGEQHHVVCGSEFWMDLIVPHDGQDPYILPRIYLKYEDACELRNDVVGMIRNCCYLIENEKFHEFKLFMQKLSTERNGQAMMNAVWYRFYGRYSGPQRTASMWNFTAYLKELKSVKAYRKFEKIINDRTIGDNIPKTSRIRKIRNSRFLRNYFGLRYR